MRSTKAELCKLLEPAKNMRFCRNVSQILSASLNQKSSSSSLLMSYQKSVNSNSVSSALGASPSTNMNGPSTSTTSSRKYTCVDCQKTVSTSRNLQRHRMSCKSALASNATKATGGQLQATVVTVPLDPTQVSPTVHYHLKVRCVMHS